MKRFISRLIISSALAASLLTFNSFASDPSEPQITIYHSEDKTFYEYTRNGEVLEIKVVPKVGEPYYLIPVGGDDQGFRQQTESSLRIPKWVIFSW